MMIVLLKLLAREIMEEELLVRSSKLRINFDGREKKQSAATPFKLEGKI